MELIHGGDASKIKPALGSKASCKDENEEANAKVDLNSQFCGEQADKVQF